MGFIKIMRCRQSGRLIQWLKQKYVFGVLSLIVLAWGDYTKCIRKVSTSSTEQGKDQSKKELDIPIEPKSEAVSEQTLYWTWQTLGAKAKGDTWWDWSNCSVKCLKSWGCDERDRCLGNKVLTSFVKYLSLTLEGEYDRNS